MPNGWGLDAWGQTPWGGGVVSTVPTNVSAPAISGITQVEYALATTPGTWTNVPPVSLYTYQWWESANGTTGWVPIGPATGTVYGLTSSDLGRFLRTSVVASNAIGPSTPAYSNVVGPVLAFVEARPATDSYVAQLFRDNGRFVDTTYGELLFQERRRRGRRVR